MDDYMISGLDFDEWGVGEPSTIEYRYPIVAKPKVFEKNPATSENKGGGQFALIAALALLLWISRA